MDASSHTDQLTEPIRTVELQRQTTWAVWACVQFAKHVQIAQSSAATRPIFEHMQRMPGTISMDSQRIRTRLMNDPSQARLEHKQLFNLSISLEL